MRHLKYFTGVVFPVLLAAGTTEAQENKAKKQPNIVCIFTDDHAFQTISAYGHPISKLAPTPNIDR
ncbi:MAG: sulfatase, partial [Prolixibacteraceae bacterium]|nr:sulfatase [Prolixibacteraceae bacterium]